MRLDVQEVGAVVRKDRRDVRRHVSIPAAYWSGGSAGTRSRVVLTLRGVGGDVITTLARELVGNNMPRIFRSLQSPHTSGANRSHTSPGRVTGWPAPRGIASSLRPRPPAVSRWPQFRISDPKIRSGQGRMLPSSSSRTSCASSSTSTRHSSPACCPRYVRAPVGWSLRCPAPPPEPRPGPNWRPPATARGGDHSCTGVHEDRISRTRLPILAAILRHLLGGASRHCRRSTHLAGWPDLDLPPMAGVIMVVLIGPASRHIEAPMYRRIAYRRGCWRHTAISACAADGACGVRPTRLQAKLSASFVSP